MIDLLRFQRRFRRNALAAGIRTAVLSLPRGNGKTTFAGHFLVDALTPGHRLNVPGAEYLLCAASIEQARLCFAGVRAALEPVGGYRFTDSNTRCGVTHEPSNTRLRVLSSSGKRAMGIKNCPLLVADEPGSWETVGGQLMFDAIQTAQGKPGSPMRCIYIGTLAPARDGWWHQLVKGGSRGSTYVQAIQGDPDRWDQWPEIRRCNPLMAKFPDSRAKLLEERDEARADSRLKARFLSYRLNVPSEDEATTLLTVDDWKRACARPEAVPAGRPVVGVDLGGGRAWSAAVAAWRSGRIEAVAVAPGVPTLAEQEKRDRMPQGTYQRLQDAGVLLLADGLRVPPATALVEALRGRWGATAVRGLRPFPGERATGRQRWVRRQAEAYQVERGRRGHPCAAARLQGWAADVPRRIAGLADRLARRLDGQARRIRQCAPREARSVQQHRTGRCGRGVGAGCRRGCEAAQAAIPATGPGDPVSRGHRRMASRRWERTRTAVFERDGWECQACAAPVWPGEAECDHVVPIEAGGDEWAMGNLQTLCRPCHRAKSRADRGIERDPEAEAWQAELCRTS